MRAARSRRSPVHRRPWPVRHPPTHPRSHARRIALPHRAVAPPFDLSRSQASINPSSFTKLTCTPPHLVVVAALPKDQAQGGAAAAGALGCVGLLVGVYRIPLNRCRCTKAQLRQGGFTRKLHHMHCARCLKRTNKGVLVSFLTSPLYCAGACAMGAQVMHTAGTPVVRAVRPAWRKVRGMIGGGGSAGGGSDR